MCLVSGKIKFCTCSKDSKKNLRHYWVFHRFIKGKDHMVLGEPVMPYTFDNKEFDLSNRKLLLRRINEPDAFDVELRPKSGDRLQLSFFCKKNSPGYIHYGFSFRKGKWVEETYDVFGWMEHHEESETGKIESALQKLNQKENT
jgi:hypothetical protein